MELGVSIKMCDQPYIKTKVIRFSNKYTLVNKMNIPLVVRDVLSDWQLLIGPKSHANIDFALLELLNSRELQIRQCQECELKMAVNSGSQTLPKQLKYFTQQSQWSKKFSCSQLGDF